MSLGTVEERLPKTIANGVPEVEDCVTWSFGDGRVRVPKRIKMESFQCGRLRRRRAWGPEIRSGYRR